MKTLIASIVFALIACATASSQTLIPFVEPSGQLVYVTPQVYRMLTSTPVVAPRRVIARPASPVRAIVPRETMPSRPYQYPLRGVFAQPTFGQACPT